MKKPDKVPTALIRLWLESNGYVLRYFPHAERKWAVTQDTHHTWGMDRNYIANGTTPVQTMRFAILAINARYLRWGTGEPTPWPWANLNNFM